MELGFTIARSDAGTVFDTCRAALMAYVSSSLLEREDALEVLRAALDRAQQGQGSTLLVRGEAGIGKTTLLREWSARVAAQDEAPVYWGSCEALFTPRPLGPVLDIAASIGSLVRDASGNQRPPSEIFAAITTWLTTAAVSLRARAQRSQATVLVFEDVHWADHLTLDFVKYLARRIHAWPALLVLSYRDDEVGPMHPLTQVLGELPSGVTSAMDLRPLSVQAIQQLSGCTSHEADDLLRVTGGNPFFVTELVAASEHDPSLRSGRSFVPVTVATAVLARIQRVSPGARTVLEVASLSPVSIDIGLLTALVGPGTHAGVDECVAAGLLQWSEQGFAFRHELARQTVENALTPMRRRSMHARVVEYLRNDSQSMLDRMAYHAQHAHDSHAVLAVAPLAAAKAAHLGAHREAAAHYRVALDHAAGADDESRARLLEQWAYECVLTDEVGEEVLAARLEAIDLRRRLGQTEKVGMNQRWVSRILRLMTRKAESERWLDDAITTLESVAAGPELAMAYSMRSSGYMLTNQRELAERWGQRAIDLAKAHDVPEIEAHALNNVGSAMVDAGMTHGFALLEQSLSIALKHGFHEHAARAYVNATEAALRGRFLARMGPLLDEGMAFVRAHDMDIYAPCMANSLAQLRLMQGRIEDADAVARQALRRDGGASVIHRTLEAVVATVSMLRDPLADGSALEQLWPQALELNEPDSIVPLAMGLAESAWLRDDHAACARFVEQALEACADSSTWDRGELLCWLLRAGVDVHPRQGEVASPCQAEIDGDLDTAAAEWQRLAVPRQQAYTLLRMARPEAVSEAIAIFDHLGAIASAQYGRRLARKLASAGVKGIKTGPRAAARNNRFGLTPKELLVASHVAHGRSNLEIASRVSRSERTVEHHVSTVLSKLGARKRNDVPAILDEAGELDTVLEITRL